MQLDTIILMMAATCTPLKEVLPLLGTARDPTARSETELRRQRQALGRSGAPNIRTEDPKEGPKSERKQSPENIQMGMKPDQSQAKLNQRCQESQEEFGVAVAPCTVCRNLTDSHSCGHSAS